MNRPRMAADPVAIPHDGVDPPGRFDRPYDRLAPLPRPVWLPTLVSAVGCRADRLDGSQAWISALTRGELPPLQADFGDAEACSPLRQVAGELRLASLCRGLPSMAEQVLRTLLWHLDRINDLQPRLARAAAIAHVSAEFREAWQQDTGDVEQDLALLRELGNTDHLQWDRLCGQLRSREWQLARRAAERLAELPALVALLDQVGRTERLACAAPRTAARVAAHSVHLPLRALETRIAGAPGELTGIRHGASLERMLPFEAALLRHRIGRRLWRARHAEGRLLAHDTEAVLVDWRADPDAPWRGADPQAEPEPLQRGPMLLCLDTSASMRGAPENIARAVVIAAARAAAAARRGCRVIAFGGPGELVERDLAGPGGLEALLETMGQAFDGGTDIQTPIERAIESVHEAAWRSADLVIVSDGEFGCVDATLARLDEARAMLGLEVHGVLVGDRETMGLLEVCDHIHWVRDWRRHADVPEGARTETLLATPVHSKSLTALYFPNALSSRAARHHPGAAR
jgi:uncharacterized protein with von Willebrand factor type A (vWA) domain